MKNGGRKVWVLLLVLLAGVLIGGVLWLLLLQVLPADMAKNSELVIGSTAAPWQVNLYLVEFTFGVQLHINPGSVVGLIIGLVIYFWRR